MPAGGFLPKIAPPRFNPAWLPNLEGWWSALDPNFVTAAADGLAAQVNDLTGRGRHLLQATGANKPTYLPWAGRNYLYLPAVTGNNVSTPSAAANRITGNIDLRISARMVKWLNVPTSAILIAKDGNTGQRSYLFWLESDSKLYFRYSPDGTTLRTATSSAVVPFSDNTDGWARTTYDTATGDVVFYTSSDGVTWNQLGTTQTITAGAIFDGTDSLRVGMQSDGVSSTGTKGRIYRAEVRSGIGGAITALFDPSQTIGNASSFVSSTGETWTVNATGNSRIAQIVGFGSLMFNPSNVFMQTAAFTLGAVTTVYLTGKQNSWIDEAYLVDGRTADQMVLQGRTTTPRVRIGAVDFGGGTVDLDTWSVKTNAVITAVFNGAASALRLNRAAAVTGTVQGGGNPAGITVGTHNASDRFSNLQMNDLLVFSAAHDAATQDKVIKFLADRIKVAV